MRIHSHPTHCQSDCNPNIQWTESICHVPGTIKGVSLTHLILMRRTMSHGDINWYEQGSSPSTGASIICHKSSWPCWTAVDLVSLTAWTTLFPPLPAAHCILSFRIPLRHRLRGAFPGHPSVLCPSPCWPLHHRPSMLLLMLYWSSSVTGWLKGWHRVSSSFSSTQHIAWSQGCVITVCWMDGWQIYKGGLIVGIEDAGLE